MNPNALMIVNVASTWYLVGLIWMVQVVHYNLYDRVGEEQFVRYERDHNQLITPIVGPVMLIELASAVGLLIWPPLVVPRGILWAAFLMVLAIWASTFWIQVPCHARLLTGFDDATYHRLVASNWIRTVLWSIRGFMLTFLLWRMLP